MDDMEIMDRARRIAHAFEREETRVAGGMRRLIRYFRRIAENVGCGEYHREGFFERAVDALFSLGFDASEANVRTLPHSDCVREAAENARDDVSELLAVAALHRSENPCAHMVVDRADDLMQCIVDEERDVERYRDRLHDVVTEYMPGRDAATGTCGEVSGKFPDVEQVKHIAERVCDERMGTALEEPRRPHGNAWDMPVKVIRQRPKANRRRPDPRTATVCLWPDGTETHAVPCEGDGYNPYTGLLTCIVKRLAALRGVGPGRLSRMVRDAVRSDGDMRADEGMFPAAAHRLALLCEGARLYEQDHDAPGSFADYVAEVADREVDVIARPMDYDFRLALLRMREDAATRAERRRVREERDRRVASLYWEATAHGAGDFEAWSYAREHAGEPAPVVVDVGITDEEDKSIAKCAWDEARARIYGAGPR